MLKKTTMIIFMISLILLLFSCGKDFPTTSDIDTTEQFTTTEKIEAPEPVLPTADFNGEKFIFLNSNISYVYASVISEEENGDTMNDAIYRRNSIIEERYNVLIEETITKEPQTDYSKSVLAGDNSFDIALLRMEWAFPAVLENTVLSWDNIPYIELDREWWVQGSIESMSLMNKVYFAVSSFDTSHLESVRGFVYNKTMANNFNLDTPYDLVKNGNWTLEKFYEMCMAVAADLDSNGVFSDSDRYGIATSTNVFGNTLMCGVGSILSIGKDQEDMPFFDLDNELHIDRLLTVSKLFEDKNSGFMSLNQSLFSDGKALFRCCLMSEITTLRDMEDDFGILPAPKYNEAQEVYINLGGSPFFMVIPINAVNLERTGLLMESLSVESMGLIDSAYYDTILMGKITRDNESVDMLELIFSTLKYYHPLANSYLNSPLADKYITSGSSDYVSYFASVKDQINADIDTAIDKFHANKN